MENNILNDSILTSMLEIFWKLEEILLTLENEAEQTEKDITFCNPSTVEKFCQECDYITEELDDFKMHTQSSHAH